MINSKLEIKLGDESVLLWFNNFSVFELNKLYGTTQEDILKKVNERFEENYMLLLSDLIKVGIKGNCLARGKTTPKIYKNINEHLATADTSELVKVWDVFYNMMGGDIKDDKKKEPVTKTANQ